MSAETVLKRLAGSGTKMGQPELERRLAHLGHDFEIDQTQRRDGTRTYRLSEFKAFVGLDGHQRSALFAGRRSGRASADPGAAAVR